MHCFESQAKKFVPKTIEIHGTEIECWPDKEFREHMVRATILCVPGARSQMQGKDDDLEEEDDRKLVMRRPVVPNSPIRRVAHWLGLQTTVSRGGSCQCRDGCHFCCVNTSTSGEDLCFTIFCSRTGGVCAY